MNFIILYRLYILFNVFTSILVISVVYDPSYTYITNTYNILLLINLLKIFNQGLIVKYLTLNIYSIYKKLIVFEGICDVLKVIVLCFLIINYKNICKNIFTCFVIWVLFANFILIFTHCILFSSNSSIISMQNTENLEINQNYLDYENRQNYVEFDTENIPNPNYNLYNFFENYNITSVQNITCSICLEEQKINENWTKIHCGHQFHKECLYRWIEINNVCPTCRYLIINV